MKIWIFNHYAHPPDYPGSTRHYDFAKELIRRGHKVIIFATSFHHYLQKETRLQKWEDWKIEDIDGILFIWIRTPSYKCDNWRRVENMAVFMFKAWLFGKKLPKLMPEIGTPDVIIGSSPDLLTALAADRLAKHQRVPFIMEVRDLWPQGILDIGMMSPNNPIIKVLQSMEKFLYKQADCIVTLLPMAHEYISTCGVKCEKIVWIPNGVDLSQFDQSASFQPISDNFRVMYFGAHSKVNVLDVLLDAAKVVQDKGYRNIEFILVGDGAEKRQLIEKARSMGLEIVKFLDPVPKTMAFMMLQEADCLTFCLEDTPLYRYGISLNKMFDYLASGKPIIFSGTAANNPVAEALCGITVPPRNPQAIAEAIITLYRMPPHMREEMGRRGQKYVAENHDISKLAGLLEHKLTHILAERRR